MVEYVLNRNDRGWTTWTCHQQKLVTLKENSPESAYHSPRTRPTPKVVTHWRTRDCSARPAVPTWAGCNCSAHYCWCPSSRCGWDRCSSWAGPLSAGPASSRSCDNCRRTGCGRHRARRGLPSHGPPAGRPSGWRARTCPCRICTSGGWGCCCWRWSGRHCWDLDCAPGVDQET